MDRDGLPFPSAAVLGVGTRGEVRRTAELRTASTLQMVRTPTTSLFQNLQLESYVCSPSVDVWGVGDELVRARASANASNLDPVASPCEKEAKTSIAITFPAEGVVPRLKENPLIMQAVGLRQKSLPYLYFPVWSAPALTPYIIGQSAITPRERRRLHA